MESNLVGQVIRGYTFVQKLGEGGFGVVYRAQDRNPTLEREVAIKFLLPELASDQDFVQGMASEARLVARLEHPFIVPLFEYWNDTSGTALVMRYLKGGSLRDELREKGRPPLDRVVQILDQISSALSAAHRSGIVHRDLKPENILRDELGNVYLSDFGLALNKGTDINDQNWGATIQYASPEQLDGAPPTPAMDIYSLGMMLYEMLAGAHPLLGLDALEVWRRQSTEPLPLLRDLPGLHDYLTELNEVLQRATAKTVDARYSDVRDLVAAFRKAAAIGDQVVDTRRVPTAIYSVLSEDPEEVVIEDHLKYLYQRLNNLYERLNTPHGDTTELDVRTRIERLQHELDYRHNGLKVIQANEPFTPPLALTPPAPQAHPLTGIDTLVSDLKARLLNGESLTLLGASGCGKSTIAAELARDTDIRAHFGGHIVWLQTGKQPDLLDLLGDWLLALHVQVEELGQLITVEQRKKRLLALTVNLPALVIVDDLWKIAHFHEALFDERSPFTFIMTTISAEVASEFLWETVRVHPLNQAKRTQLLAALVPELATETPDVQRLLEVIGGLPRDLLLLGKRLRRVGSATSRLTREVEKLLRQPQDILKEGYASLQLTVDELSADARRTLWTVAQLPAEPNSIGEEAAEAIVGDLASLDELVDFSLLRVDEDRYLLSPGFAEFARQRLTVEEPAVIHAAIIAYYAQVAETKQTHYPQLARAWRNVETALELAFKMNDARAVSMVLLLTGFWSAYGMVDAAERWLQAAMRQAEAQQATELSGATGQRARLALAAARLEQTRGNLPEAEAYSDQALELAGDTPAAQPLRLEVLLHRGHLHRNHGNYEAAQSVWTQALALAQELHDTAGLSDSYGHLGTLEATVSGNPEAAKTLFLQSLAAARQVKDNYRISRAAQNVAGVYLRFFGDFERAKPYVLESVELARTIGNAERLSAALQMRGHLELTQDRFEQAQLFFDEALVQARISRSVEATGWALLTLANVVISLKQVSRAETLLAESFRNATRLEDRYLTGSVLDVWLKSGEIRLVHGDLSYDSTLWETMLTGVEQEVSILAADKIAWLRELFTRLKTAAAAGAVSPVIQWQAHLNLGLLEADTFRDYAGAKAHFERSLALAVELTRPDLRFLALLELVRMAHLTDDLTGAEESLRQGLDLLEGVVDDPAKLIAQATAVAELRLRQQADAATPPADSVIWQRLLTAVQAQDGAAALTELIRQFTASPA